MLHFQIYLVNLKLIDLPNLIGFTEAMLLDDELDQLIPWVRQFLIQYAIIDFVSLESL